MRNLQHLNASHDDFKNTSAEIVREHHIRINREELRHEGLNQLPLIVEQLNVGLIALLQPLLKIEWPWIAGQSPD